MADIRLVILDAEGRYDNTIVWDGVTEWAPPEGYTTVPEDSPEGQDAIAANTARLIAEQEALQAQRNI